MRPSLSSAASLSAGLPWIALSYSTQAYTLYRHTWQGRLPSHFGRGFHQRVSMRSTAAPTQGTPQGRSTGCSKLAVGSSSSRSALRRVFFLAQRTGAEAGKGSTSAARTRRRGGTRSRCTRSGTKSRTGATSTVTPSLGSSRVQPGPRRMVHRFPRPLASRADAIPATSQCRTSRATRSSTRSIRRGMRTFPHVFPEFEEAVRVRS